MARQKKHSPEILLRKLSSFASAMTPEQQQELLQLGITRQYKKESIICHEGDVATNMYCIIEGSAKVCMRGDEEHWQIVELMKPGDFYGYTAFFTDQNYMTNCIAVEESTVFIIPMNFIVKCMEENKEFMLYFLRFLSLLSRNVSTRFVGLNQKHLRGRLAYTLLYLMEHFGFEANGKTLDVRLSREEMANASCMTTANAIRTLSAFVSEGLISMERRRITLLDIPTLKHISKHD